MAGMRAAEGIVEVWRADLAAVEDGVGELLCAEERERARQIRSARTRQLWIRSRGVLRALLARYLDADPHELRFVLGPHGKPALRDGDLGAGGDLRFNLSHSASIALYAVTVGHEVGVDVEIAHRPVDELAIAARVLGSAQAGRLAKLGPEARTREFLRAWVAHEAAVKCRGSGLAKRSAGAPDDLWTSELDVGPNAAAAVASAGGECELRYREWRG